MRKLFSFYYKIKERIRGSKDSKILLSNFISLFVLQIAGYVFPLLTIPYLANVIGVEKYGEIAFASAVMVYLQTVVDYGFVFSAVRDIARRQNNRDEVAEIYTNVMWSRFFLVLLSFFILVILILTIPKLSGIKWVLFASFFTVIGHAMFPDWMFQALEKMKFVTLFNIIIKLFFTGAVFIFIRSQSDYILQPILTSLGYVISGIGAMWLIHRWGIRFGKPRIKLIKQSLKSNFDLFINQLVPNLYSNASILLLGFFHGNIANGIFDAANRFNQAGVSFFSIISRTFYPFLSRRMDKHNYFKKLNIVISLIVAGILFFGSPYIIHTFFPPDFNGAINVLRIISVSIVFLALNNVYGTNYLIIKGYEKEVRRITVYSSILGFIIAIPTIYYWSYIGVAITVAVSRGIMGIACMFKSKMIKDEINEID